MTLDFVSGENERSTTRIYHQTHQTAIDLFSSARALTWAETDIDTWRRVEGEQSLLIDTQWNNFDRTTHHIGSYLPPITVFDTNADGYLALGQITKRYDTGAETMHHSVILIHLYSSDRSDGSNRAELRDKHSAV